MIFNSCQGIVIHIEARLEVLAGVPLRSTEKESEKMVEIREDRNLRENLCLEYYLVVLLILPLFTNVNLG